MTSRFHHLTTFVILCAVTSTVGAAITGEFERDFGRSKSQEKVLHTFKLRNDSDSPVGIKTIKPACGCTVASAAKRRIEPHETIDLKVTLSLKDRRGFVRKSILVETNDPAQPTLTLYIQGYADPTISVTPERVFFGYVPSDKPSEKAVEIKAEQEGLEFHVLNAASGSSHIEVESELVEEGKAYRLIVRTAPPLPAASLAGRITVETDHPDFKQITIPVRGMIEGALTVSPTAITLLANQSKPVTRYIFVGPGRVKSFAVTEASIPDTDTKLSIQKVGLVGYRIKVDNLLPERMDGKTIRIMTDAPEASEIDVPIRVAGAAEPEEPKQ